MHSIILVEDHSIVRLGIKALLEESKKFVIEGSYSTGVDGLKGIKEKEPDFAIVDLNLPDLAGEMIVRDLFLNDSKTKVIILSHQKYIPQVSHLLNLKIAGYVVKDNAAEELLLALEKAGLGERYLSPSIEELLIRTGHLNPKKSSKAYQKSLTRRELEIARMICQGDSSAEIASKLSLAPVTIRVYTKNIIEKLGLNDLSDIAKIRDQLF